jgi:hypothetical protein
MVVLRLVESQGRFSQKLESDHEAQKIGRLFRMEL